MGKLTWSVAAVIWRVQLNVGMAAAERSVHELCKNIDDSCQVTMPKSRVYQTLLECTTHVQTHGPSRGLPSSYMGAGFPVAGILVGSIRLLAPGRSSPVL